MEDFKKLIIAHGVAKSYYGRHKVEFAIAFNKDVFDKYDSIVRSVNMSACYLDGKYSDTEYEINFILVDEIHHLKNYCDVLIKTDVFSFTEPLSDKFDEHDYSDSELDAILNEIEKFHKDTVDRIRVVHTFDNEVIKGE